MLLRLLRVLPAWLCAAVLLPAPVSAEPVADFYSGKTVSLIVSSSPGGGYDTLARTLAKHLGNHIPGKPAVVVRNMPGAGGIVATNHLFNLAAKDGTVIGGVQNNTSIGSGAYAGFAGINSSNVNSGANATQQSSVSISASVGSVTVR